MFDALISVVMIMLVFVFAYGCVWVIQKIRDKRNDDIAI